MAGERISITKSGIPSSLVSFIISNLSHCSDKEIEAIRIALKMKKQIVYGLLTDEQGDTCCHEKETE